MESHYIGNGLHISVYCIDGVFGKVNAKMF